jgi:Flp pilus assembly protein TadB
MKNFAAKIFWFLLAAAGGWAYATLALRREEPLNSAYILIAMPFGIVLMLMVVNPGYMNSMFTHPLGWGMIGASVILMTIGSLWMRKIIDLKF